ncbi:MAG: hypothetical protein ABSA83_16220 [Verrucomicrobiota bacterium]
MKKGPFDLFRPIQGMPDTFWRVAESRAGINLARMIWREKSIHVVTGPVLFYLACLIICFIVAFTRGNNPMK